MCWSMASVGVLVLVGIVCAQTLPRYATLYRSLRAALTPVVVHRDVRR